MRCSFGTASRLTVRGSVGQSLKGHATRCSFGTASRTQNLLHLIDHPFELALCELKAVMNTQLASPPAQHDSLNVATPQTSCEEGGIVTDTIGKDGSITTFAIGEEGGASTKRLVRRRGRPDRSFE
ncbi:MAG: hypothetical protein F6K55_39070 [Moorea sp. SIO4A3]|nr:hypothetical protein [Moorena sp. SIO4A3]